MYQSKREFNRKPYYVAMCRFVVFFYLFSLFKKEHIYINLSKMKSTLYIKLKGCFVVSQIMLAMHGFASAFFLQEFKAKNMRRLKQKNLNILQLILKLDKTLQVYRKQSQLTDKHGKFKHIVFEKYQPSWKFPIRRN